MDNKQIYKKTLGFSIRRLLWDIASFLILGALTFGGFFLAGQDGENGLIGLGIGFVVGLIVLIVLLRFVSYRYKAGQIAMMTKGVTEGELPEDVIGEGKRIVKERFATVAAFFAITGAIRGIFNQLGRAISSLGEKIGGDNGGNIGDAISMVLQVVVSYLCDCCLGWVFYRREVKAAKATCEGAVLFFKHGKTLAKNMGRVFGYGLASLVLIGGAFSGIFYLIFSRFPEAFTQLAEAIKTSGVNPEAAGYALMTNPATVPIACASLAGIILWSILHNAFVRPFVLVGVLRNYVASGMNDIPTAASFALLDSKSAKFAKLHREAA